jgi:hypothetical protein
MDGVGFRGPVVHQGLPRWLIRLQSGLQDHELDGNARHKSQIYIGLGCRSVVPYVLFGYCIAPCAREVLDCRVLPLWAP